MMVGENVSSGRSLADKETKEGSGRWKAPLQGTYARLRMRKCW